jgi:hypothetical protein
MCGALQGRRPAHDLVQFFSDFVTSLALDMNAMLQYVLSNRYDT